MSKIYLYRLTHVENIPHILRFGITHSNSKNANLQYKSIGDKSMISSRANFLLDNGENLGDYTPFYFGIRMPMLYVIQNGFNNVETIPAKDLVYCVTTVQRIIDNNLKFIFTNGHAVNNFSSQYSISEVENIQDLVDWKAVEAKYWNDENDLDLKRRKEAEFLILGDLPLHVIGGYLVYNEDTKNRLIDFGVKEREIVIKPEFYF